MSVNLYYMDSENQDNLTELTDIYSTVALQGLKLSKGAKRTIFCNITVILRYCGIKQLHGVDTCIGMIQVYQIWSLNYSALQTLRYKISLFEFPLLKL